MLDNNHWQHLWCPNPRTESKNIKAAYLSGHYGAWNRQGHVDLGSDAEKWTKSDILTKI
jgi:hypothetical protein